MALLFRKKHVISSIRAAYLLKHHDNGLVVDDSADSVSSNGLQDVDLANLSIHLQADTSAENLTRMLSRSPVSPSTPASEVSVPDAGGGHQHSHSTATGLAGVPELHTAPDMDKDGPPDIKDFGINSDEDSDFEEDLLRVAHEIKFSSEPNKRRLTSESDTRRSNHSSPSKHSSGQAANAFTKRDPAAHAAAESSRLTSQLTAKTRDPREQYLEAVAGLGNDGKSGVRLKMHMSSKQKVDVVVRQDCTGHLALGYALLRSGEEPGDANMYNLRLAEDDGEPDDDFPALDRSRPVAAYHVDEVAVVRATETEFRENSKRTPNKISFRAKPNPEPVAKEPTPLPVDSQQPYQTQSNHTFAGSLSGARTDSVALRMFMDPYDPLLSDVFWEDTMVARQSRLTLVFEQMCREKMMDPEMFVLRTVDERHKIVNLNATVSSLFPKVASAASQEQSASLCLEVVPRRNLTGPANGRQMSVPLPSGPTPVATELTRDSKERNRSIEIPPGPVLPMQPHGFYKYPVLRRQQMNFLSRAERELVIDGEYVHIMPPTDWSLLDQPKTTTFHIRQVIRVKQRKVPTNFCVTVMKTTGPKRYDMESKDASTTAEIVNRIQSLKNARIGSR